MIVKYFRLPENLMEPTEAIREFGEKAYRDAYREAGRILAFLGFQHAYAIRGDRKLVSICMGIVAADLAIRAGTDGDSGDSDGSSGGEMQEGTT